MIRSIRHNVKGPRHTWWECEVFQEACNLRIPCSDCRNQLLEYYEWDAAHHGLDRGARTLGARGDITGEIVSVKWFPE